MKSVFFIPQEHRKTVKIRLAESILNGYNEHEESTDKRLLSVNSFD